MSHRWSRSLCLASGTAAARLACPTKLLSRDGGGLTLADAAAPMVADGATRLDSRDVDLDAWRLIIARMGDNEVLVVDLRDGVLLPAAVERYSSSALLNLVVSFDSDAQTEAARCPAGQSPDELASCFTHRVVAASTQKAAALTRAPGGGAEAPPPE